MAKVKYKTEWFCSDCGASSSKWQGRCPSCGSWNTLVEEKVSTGKSNKSVTFSRKTESKPTPVSQIVAGAEQRIPMPSQELNRVLGGGLVTGSLVLIGGEPGIGKSTLVLQNILSIKSRKVLYLSGEESAKQIKMRADRIGRPSDNVLVACTTSLEEAMQHIESEHPGLVIVDSIQTIASDAMESTAGSISQVRECAATLLKYAKESNTPIVLIGHITKDGNIAGPKVLEHIVDAVLQFEGDRNYVYRILRPIKNRFGNTSEIGIYEMCQRGLREVINPSEMLVSHSDENTGLSGAAIGITMDGMRPFLIETQSLVSTAAYGTPQRVVTGFESKRLNLLLAVLEKRVGFKLGQKDVFLNIAGGIRVNDPALDLAVICAVLSSNVDICIPSDVCMAGEIGLTGEIRPVTRVEQRIAEAQKLGMHKIFIPQGNLKGVDKSDFNIQIFEASRVEDVFRMLFS